jgi:hypothetical protein
MARKRHTAEEIVAVDIPAMSADAPPAPEALVWPATKPVAHTPALN